MGSWNNFWTASRFALQLPAAQAVGRTWALTPKRAVHRMPDLIPFASDLAVKPPR